MSNHSNQKITFLYSSDSHAAELNRRCRCGGTCKAHSGSPSPPAHTQGLWGSATDSGPLQTRKGKAQIRRPSHPRERHRSACLATRAVTRLKAGPNFSSPPAAPWNLFSPPQFDGALSTDRVWGDWVPKIKGQDLLGPGQAAAWVLPQRVGLGLLALPEVQGTLRRLRGGEGVQKQRADSLGMRGSCPVSKV